MSDEIGAAPGRRDVVARTARNLEGFAVGLPEAERAALQALLRLGTRLSPLVELARLPAEEVLTRDEVEQYRRLADEPMPPKRPSPSSLVVVLKATRICNLRCTYCHFWDEGPNQRMTFEVMARTIRDALWTQGTNAVDFVWHGGEVTLRDPAFYRKAIWIQQQFRQHSQRVGNSLQTNGTRLTDAWIELLATFDFDVGVSLDGPPDLHDRRRRDAADRPTSAAVREGIRRLRAADVKHGVLIVVDADVAAVAPETLLDYLVEIGLRDVAILNVIPENVAPGEPVRGAYLPWPAYVAWLRDLFTAWWPHYADRLSIRELHDLVRKVAGQVGQTCLFAGGCHGRFLTVEPAGDVSACDKYVGDAEYELGNVLETRLHDMVGSSQVAAIRRANRDAIEPMRRCRWFAVCQGGCPHDRRLNERYVAGHGGGCCGLAALLGDIDREIHAATDPASSIAIACSTSNERGTT